SIDLYTKYLSEAEGAKEKELFEYLIGEERQHFAVLEELVSMLRHAEDWVENAEFGIREEY
ncbi:MAG: rubrerythrin, partial [Smithella sp.]